jgi:hypothetical protein
LNLILPIPNFYNSDNNALLNSVNDQRESTFALDADYGYGTTPINFGLLISLDQQPPLLYLIQIIPLKNPPF